MYTNMTTQLNDLVKALEAAQIKFELNGACSSVKTCMTFQDIEIGISLESGVWFWFTVCVNSLDDTKEVYYMFKQRYNQNNGVCIKAWKTGFNFKFKIEQLLNVAL